MAADGTLRFDTKIDKDGAEKDIKTLKQTLQGLVDTLSSTGKNIDNAFSGKGSKITDLNGKIEVTQAKIEKLTAEIQNMANIPFASKDADKLTKQIEKAEQQMLGLLNQREALEGSLGSGISGLGIGEISQESLKTLFESNKQWQELTGKINLAEASLSKYENELKQVQSVDANTSNTDTSAYQDKKIKLEQLTNQLETYKAKLAEVQQKENAASKSTSKMGNSVKKTGKHIDKTGKSASGFGKTLQLLKMSLLFSVTFQALSAAMNAVKEGFQNLAQYSSSTNKNLSSLMTALLTLKNSFATAFDPILTAITPALQTLINYLSQAVTMAGQFFAVFFNGATTFTKAKEAQVDYAKSLAKTAKEADKALSPIDKLNNVGDSSGGNAGTPGMPSPSQMFEEVEIDSKFIDSVNKFKNALSTLFEPIKSAWDTYGQPTMDALQYAAYSIKDAFALIGQSFADIWLNGSGETLIGNILQLLTTVLNTVGDIGLAFQNAWNADGTGNAFLQSIFDILNSILELLRDVSESFRDAWNSGVGESIISNILQILTNVNDTIANIATNFKNAWNADNTGTKIIQDILTMLNDVLSAINDVSKATSDWAAGLDFTPILTSFQNLISSAEPLVGTIADGLSWFYTNVLLPIAGWAITDVIPLFFDGLAAALDLLNGVLEALQPLGLWLFESFLKPIAEWTGGVITEVLGFIVEKLQAFADWINENQTAVETITTVIGSFVAAWGVVNLAMTIGGIVAALAAFVTTGGLAATVGGTLAAVIGFITSPVTLVVAAIGALIAIGVLLYKNWDVIKAKAIEIWGAIKDWFKKTIDDIGKFFSGLWTGIKETFASVGNWFKTIFTTAWTNIKTAFSLSNIKTFFTGIWSGIKNAFGSVTDWFKDTFSKAWQAVKDVFSAGGKIFSGIKDGIADVFKTVVNTLINGINTIISVPFNKINDMLNTIRNVNILGAKPFSGLWGQNPLAVPKIPKLATGAVIPPNSQFLALLGDQKRGVNIEAPLETILEAFRRERSESGGQGDITIIAQVDGETLFKITKTRAELYTSQTGEPAFT